MRGRDPKLTAQKIKLAGKLLEEGHYANTVQAAIGVSQQSWYTWVKVGRALAQQLDNEEITPDKLTPFDLLQLDFFETVKAAEAKAEMESLKAIRRAGKKQWQAHAWYLERKFRDRWGRMYQDQGDGKGNETALDKFLHGVDDIAAQPDEEVSE